MEMKAVLKIANQTDNYVKMTFLVNKEYFKNECSPEVYSYMDGMAVEIAIPNDRLNYKYAECFIAPYWNDRIAGVVFARYAEYTFANISDLRELVERGVSFLVRRIDF